MELDKVIITSNSQIWKILVFITDVSVAGPYHRHFYANLKLI